MHGVAKLTLSLLAAVLIRMTSLWSVECYHCRASVSGEEPQAHAPACCMVGQPTAPSAPVPPATCPWAWLSFLGKVLCKIPILKPCHRPACHGVEKSVVWVLVPYHQLLSYCPPKAALDLCQVKDWPLLSGYLYCERICDAWFNECLWDAVTLSFPSLNGRKRLMNNSNLQPDL